jgi:hypothetical protein
VKGTVTAPALPPIAVKQTPDAEVPIEILASDIQKIATAAQALFASRLQDRTIYMLISKASGIGMRDVEFVLNAARRLAIEYLKPSTSSK